MKANLQVFKHSESLSQAAVDIFVQAARQAARARGRFLAALSGGGGPSGLYHLLATAPYRDQIEWASVYIFWGDERCVPPDDEGSNYHQAWDIFLSHVPIPAGNIQRIRGELEPAEASEEYASVLKRFAAPGLAWPRFDLALLGMGEDGHTASLFPGSPVEATSPTLAVSGHYQGRPANRVTLTPPVFNSARKVLFLVTGGNKAVTLSRVFSDVSMPEQYPAQRIRPTNGEVIWLVDEAAASQVSR